MSKKTNNQTAKVNWPITILLIIGCLTVFFPLYMAVIIAFKQPSEMTNDIAGALAFPKTWSFANFSEAMKVTDFWHSLGNSLLLTIVTVILAILIHSLAIRVPAHIQMEGYDVPQYANVQYPWEGREEVEPGQIPERFNPVASYVKYFEVPEEMEGKKVFISFQGAESGIAVWLNGNFVGYSEDTFTPSEFELTPYLKEGENKLAAQVFKWTSSSWCEDQDFFRFSGIYRDVYLYAIPEVHVSDVKIQTLLDDTFTRGNCKRILNIG